MSKAHPAAAHARTAIRNPDQLQQARRPAASAAADAGGRQREPREVEPAAQGILGQLAAERAHD